MGRELNRRRRKNALGVADILSNCANQTCKENGVFKIPNSTRVTWPTRATDVVFSEKSAKDMLLSSAFKCERFERNNYQLVLDGPKGFAMSVRCTARVSKCRFRGASQFQAG